jgi:hypothetical protein
MTTLPLDPYIAIGGEFHNPTSPGENAYAEPPLMRSFAAAIRSEIGSTVPPPPDLSNFYTKAQSDARFEQFANKAVASGYAPLDAAGLVPTVHIPPLAINDTFVVASEAEMLALTAQRGDMAIRTDTGRTYVLSAEPASTLANWKEVLAAGQVTSVNGKTGVVNLTATDVGAYTKAESDAKYALIGASYTKAESDAKYSLIGHNHDAAYLPIGTPIPPPTHITSTNGSVTIVESPTGTFDLAAAGAGGGSVTVLRDEEFAPAAAATTVTLAATPTDIHTVTRNGVVQSVAAGHYTVAGAVLTFSDAFVAGERVSVVYSIGTSVPVDSWTQAEADARFVNVPGDTMTGVLAFRYGSSTTLGRIGQVVNDGLWSSVNARFDGTNWQRDDTTKNAWIQALTLNSWELLSSAPGANPLTNYISRFKVATDFVTVSDVYLRVETAAGQPGIQIRGPVSQWKALQYDNLTGGARWLIGSPPTSESYDWHSYSDTGAYVGRVLSADRNSRQITIDAQAQFTSGFRVFEGGSNPWQHSIEGNQWVVRNPSSQNMMVMGPGGNTSIGGNLTVLNQVSATAGQSLTIYSPNSIVINPANALFHPVNNTVWLGHNTIPWAYLWVTTVECSGEGHFQGTLKANGNGIVQAGSDGGAYCQYMYSGIFATWSGNFAIKNNSGFQFQPSNVNFFVIENSANGFYTNTDNVVTCGRNGNRFSSVWAGNGSIQTCLTVEKTEWRGLDPEEALLAILRTPIQKYKVARPALPEGMGAGDDKLYDFDFVGFRAEAVDPLFLLDGDKFVSPQHTASVAVSGIQALYNRIAKLEAIVRELTK